MFVKEKHLHWLVCLLIIIQSVETDRYAQALLSNGRLGWRCLPLTNALAYCSVASVFYANDKGEVEDKVPRHSS